MLVVGMLVLVTGVLAGLARLSFNVPAFAMQAAGQHSAMMIAAFFGTVIGLERAVALGHPIWYLAPALAGLGGIADLSGSPVLGASLCLAGSLVFAAGSIKLTFRLPALFTATLAFGSIALVLGNLVWLTSGMPVSAIPLWISFLVLTIAGERLELTRMLPPQPGKRQLFVLILIFYGLGCIPAVLADEYRPLSVALLMLSLWLWRFDVARLNAKGSGLSQFVAISLLSGYAMLAVGSALGLSGAFTPGHAWRDAALHAVLLGFVFSMVIGHAPLIFPAVMRVKIPYHPVFYLPLLALNLSLAVRMVGVILDRFPLRAAGAFGNAVSLILLVVILLARVLAGRRSS